MTGVSGSGTTSEYVRQELRAVVGARTGQTQAAPGRPPSQLLNQVNPDLDALGINFEMPTSGKGWLYFLGLPMYVNPAWVYCTFWGFL